MHWNVNILSFLSFFRVCFVPEKAGARRVEMASYLKYKCDRDSD